MDFTDYDLTDIIAMLHEKFPDKMVVDISEYENEDHQSFKFLYETFSDVKSSLEMENANLLFKFQELEKDYSVLRSENETLKKNNQMLSDDFFSSINSFKNVLNEKIFVMNVKAEPEFEGGGIFDLESLYKTISSCPGVYGSYRPSWFTPAGIEMSKESVCDKNIQNTVPLITKYLMFWKSNRSKLSNQEQCAGVASDYDITRKNDIEALLRSDCSNEERYLKYYLLSPGLDREFLKTLDGASELNIDARLVISLLEQPNSRFNKEIIESFVSKLHKGTEYNLKQEVAEDLIKGKWFISADVNGKHEAFQLVPVSIIDNFINKIDEIYNFLVSLSGGELSAGPSESSPTFSEGEKDIEDYVINDFDDSYNSSIIEMFDDSML